MGGHIHAKQVECAVVEVDVSAYAVERLPCGEDCGRHAIGKHPADGLRSPTVPVEGTQSKVGMIARSTRTCRLHAIAALSVFFQIEAVDEPPVEILEVCIGVERNTVLRI